MKGDGKKATLEAELLNELSKAYLFIEHGIYSEGLRRICHAALLANRIVNWKPRCKEK